MNKYRKLLVIPLGLLAFLWFAAPVTTYAVTSNLNGGTSSPSPTPQGEKSFGGNCTIDTTKPGVLISGSIKTGGFPCYATVLLRNNMPYVILAAVILVVISGIQYMIAMGSPAEQAKAKTRILGVLAGIIFYFLLQYITPLLASGIRV